MTAKILRLFESGPSSSPAAPWSLTASLYYYTRLYGAQLVLVTLLSAVTIYRREMSCNRVYTDGEVVTRSKRRRHPEHKEREEIPDEVWEESAEVLLEGAGAYCSGEPILPVVLKLWASLFFESLTDGSISHFPRARGTNRIAEDLPSDVQVHILSYLHPKDVVTFACTSRSGLAVVDSGETSNALWKTLWHRDYSWVVHSFQPGIEALRRSQPVQYAFDKEFYFLFGQAFVNYILAGQNTYDECLVGLHGHIYEITGFLHTHPGSPETLMVQAGKDATRFFEDMNHSSGARRLAQSLCVVVNNFCSANGCGLRPTTLTPTVGDPRVLPSAVEAPVVPMERTKEPRRPGTLQSFRQEFLSQQQQKVNQVASTFASNPNVLSHVNVFYDPFRREWRGWYTNAQFETVYMEEI